MRMRKNAGKFWETITDGLHGREITFAVI